MTYNKKDFKEFEKQLKEELNKIKTSSYNKYLELLYLISRYGGLVLFRTPDEDCDPEEQSVPVTKFLFLNSNAAITSIRSGEKVENICRDIYEEKISNIILLNNPFPNDNLDELREFKKNFKKLINVYSEKYGIEVILIDLEEFYEN